MTLFVFCHCPFQEHSPAICARLYNRVRALVPLPALPWTPGELERGVEQVPLF
jgi:hypothetical protein